VLSLSETAIADDAFAALARTRLSRHLQQLNLSHTLITDAGVTHLTSTFGCPYFERWRSIFGDTATCKRRATNADFAELRTLVLDGTLVTPASTTVLNRKSVGPCIAWPAWAA